MFINDQVFRERMLASSLACLRMTLVTARYMKEARRSFAERNMLGQETPDIDAVMKDIEREADAIEALFKASSHHP